ncbi:uncharacterized protein CIMG_13054 [Coccidioides immitis RS]|uniref:Uncharacterized protein n=1 Tax=Coccidioides immitis (strain RS) TaxID=246410 RepID=A0A0D8JTV0_COCIM|nr:uncharacterized protein CIMG_13054 [Coccidioides immitis RS]KJF60569.1 hypothetical protein CIMG_13054 [Coccidioides immitis RS]
MLLRQRCILLDTVTEEMREELGSHTPASIHTPSAITSHHANYSSICWHQQRGISPLMISKLHQEVTQASLAGAPPPPSIYVQYIVKPSPCKNQLALSSSESGGERKGSGWRRKYCEDIVRIDITRL